MLWKKFDLTYDLKRFEDCYCRRDQRVWSTQWCHKMLYIFWPGRSFNDSRQEAASESVGKQGFKIARINDDNILILLEDQQVFITGNDITGLRIDGTGDNHIVIRISANIRA